MVRLLFYAINGTGLGHLTRLLAIGRAVRELAQALGLDTDLRFVTTSEGTGAVWDFPVYKLPSNTVVAQSGLDREAFVAGSRLMVINLVAGLHPDVLVTDTVPHGAFGEMALLRGHARAMVYVDRHKDPSVSDSDLYRSHLPLYDRILVPDTPDQAGRYPLPRELSSRRRFVGPVHGYRPTLERQQIRDTFKLAEGRRLLFLAAGGGGDRDSRANLDRLVEALAADPRNHLLIGYGPLHRGAMHYGPNLTPLQEFEASRFFPGLDAAVSAAGYNSYQELLAARVPTVFFAQPKGMDRQDERIAHGLEQGWHTAFSRPPLELEPLQIRTRVEELLEGPSRARLVQALESRPPAEGALSAAVELLALHASLKGSPVKRPPLLQVALLRRAWDGRGDFAGAAKAWRTWQQAALSPAARAEREEQAVLAWHGNQQGDLDLRWGMRLASWPRELARGWCLEGPGDEGYERRQRESLGDTLACLTEHLGPVRALELVESLKNDRKGMRDELSRQARLLEETCENQR